MSDTPWRLVWDTCRCVWEGGFQKELAEERLALSVGSTVLIGWNDRGRTKTPPHTLFFSVLPRPGLCHALLTVTIPPPLGSFLVYLVIDIEIWLLLRCQRHQGPWHSEHTVVWS